MKSSATSNDFISVFAPATVANVGPGFDCFGFALAGAGDTVHARLTDEPGVHIARIANDDGRLPLPAAENTAGKAAQTVWQQAPDLSKSHGLELEIIKGLPLSAGLGGSAASAVAGAVAAMHLVAQLSARPFDDDLVLQAALTGEMVASGSRHADNVAPALYGGFTVVQANEPPHIARFIPQIELHVAAVTPAIAVSTKAAREALPKMIPLPDAAQNWANSASLVLALLTGDEILLRAALHDVVVEPCRAKLIPDFAAAKNAALECGVFGCSISGSGPTLFALAPSRQIAQSAAEAMCAVFARRDLHSDTIVTIISPEGARRL